LWDFCGVKGDKGERILIDGDDMLAARWFPDAKLNFADNLLRRRDDAEAIVSWTETEPPHRLTYAQLYEAVARTARKLQQEGVGAGDRVAGFLPNTPEAVIAMLATAALGAIWSSCSPDFGVQGAVDRFAQIEPKFLFAADGYTYNAKFYDIRGRVREIEAQLPSLRQKKTGHGLTRIFTDYPFNHPAFILFSSGTTGLPKCIVHGAGGTLLQHLKEHQLHTDIRPGDRVFYFTTTGWMMWNWLVSALASGATIVLYDGAPLANQGRILWDLAERERVTHFGVSAKYIDAIAKQGLEPVRSHKLDRLRTILSTGSPLAPESFDYVYRSVKRDVCLSSISGGTDIISCFALGCPTLPVWRGELQCRGLGMKVEILDDEGNSIRGKPGELVCTAPFPSQPVGFWNDPNSEKYRAAYFERYPNVWHHGDFAELTEHDGVVIHGRSDAVLNPGGVRIGTAEIYRQVEQLEEVLECLAVGQQWNNDTRILLFVKLREGLTLDQALMEKIKRRISINTSPRHVPAKIIQTPDIPRTRNGKIAELAVRNVIHGRPVDNLEALANPDSLEHFRQLPR
jgi:acetoacetyl-CoA synthetase